MKELLGSLELNRIYQMDCLKGMKFIKDKSIDMILCDLPYGTTDANWDKQIPSDKLWEEYERIIKDNGAIVLFASQPFTTLLINSNLKLYKYNWIWKKSKASNFMNAKLQPLKVQEDICVFSKGGASNGSKIPMNYFPQGLIEVNKKCKNGKNVGGEVNKNKGRSLSVGNEYIQKYTNYPTNILEFEHDKEKLHPTQKPVLLLEYLIKTYTQEGDIVLDNCIGSGSTAVACVNTKRNYIGFELNDEYYRLAENRIKEHLLKQNN